MKSYSNFAVLSVVSLISTHIATAFEIKYPLIRFTPYDDLTDDQKAAASGLGYTKETWNTPGSYDLEWWPWWYQTNEDYYDLDGDEDYYDDQTLFVEYASKLGFSDNNGDNDAWDCWSAHYTGYSWADLEEYQLDESYKVLGWTETMWTNKSKSEPLPELDNKYYKELTYAEKTAAGVVCYTKSLWDEDELPFALDSPRAILVGKKKKNRNCNWASGDLNRCNLMKKGIAKHCCNTCGTCERDKCVDTVGRFLWNKRKRDNKKLYKKCGFLKGDNKFKNCKKWGMKETCPTKCNSAACVN